MCLHAHLKYAHASRVLEYMKGKFLGLNSCKVNPTSFGSHLTPLYDHYKKVLKGTFTREDEYIQDSLENSESKREFLNTKTSSSQVLLGWDLFWSWLLSSKTLLTF